MNSQSSTQVTTEQAIACYRNGSSVDAERLAQSVVEAGGSPRETAVCLQLLGLISHKAGQYSEAIVHYQRAFALKPDVAELRLCLCDTFTALARRLRKQSQLVEAERCAREALHWHPNSPDSLNVLGVLLHEQHRHNEARRCFSLGIVNSPQHPQLRLNFANLLADLSEWDDAIAQYRLAVEIRPDDVRTLLCAGAAMSTIGRHQGEIQLLERALRLDGDNADAHFNMGNAQVGIHQAQSAVRHYEAAVKLRPDWKNARANWMRQRAELCDWRDDWDRQIRSIVHDLSTHQDDNFPTPLNPSQTPGLPIPRQLMRQIACHETTRIRQALTFKCETDLQPARQSGAGLCEISSDGRRLRIGYLSHDFRHHAIGHLTCRLFALHDRSRFEVFTYSLGPNDGSSYRNRIQDGSEHFRDLAGIGDAQLLQRIRQDQVDILIDIQGYSAPSLPKVLLARPAPILIHYLGFPGTLGGLVDYFVTDSVITPPGSPLRDEFTESLIYLPDTYQVTDNQPEVLDREITREECGLPSTGFVFCAFNNNYKIQPQIFDVWMRILRKIRDSVVWLLSMQSSASENLRREAAARGVDPDRLIFANVVSKPEHLSRLPLADLFLDTSVCGAHTTATDSLWAGVPVVTCPGERFTERVAASLMSAVGLNELIVNHLDDYEKLVMELSMDRDRLQRIREELSNSRDSSRLFATADRVRQLEQAYEIVWKRHREGLCPTDVFVADNGP